MNTMMEMERSLGLLESEMTKYFNNIGMQLGKIGQLEETLIYSEYERGKLETDFFFLGKRVGEMQEDVLKLKENLDLQLLKWKENVDLQLFKWKENVDLQLFKGKEDVIKMRKDVAKVIISLKGSHSTLIGKCKEEIDDNKVYISFLWVIFY